MTDTMPAERGTDPAALMAWFYEYEITRRVDASKNLDEFRKVERRDVMASVIQSMADAGYIIVPKEATEAMALAGVKSCGPFATINNSAGCYRAMTSAHKDTGA